jgi:hypothetical protein
VSEVHNDKLRNLCSSPGIFMVINVVWVPVTMTWLVFRFHMEDMACRYGG